MPGYYTERLSGDRLRRCYDLASERVRQYLEAEIRFVQDRLESGDRVLELGCGYGRVAHRLADVPARIIGIDTSAQSLVLARTLGGPGRECKFFRMDATSLGFRDGAFDWVVCVQNGICAFGVDPEILVREALRVTRRGGRALFSSYAEAFWPYRLAWFEAQAAARLIGEIDYGQTGDGTIVCKDGFRAGTFTPDNFRTLSRRLGVEPVIEAVDDCSVFCEFQVS